MNDERASVLPALLGWGVLLVIGALLLRQVISPRLGASQGPNHPAVGTSLAIGQLAPLEEGETVSGEWTDASLKGQVSLINFWGTWCPPCREEMPELVALNRVYRADNRVKMAFVSVGDTDVERLREETASFLDKNGWRKLGAYHDASGTARRAVRTSIGVEVRFPTTVIVDSEGVVRGVWEGYFHGAVDQMAELLKSLTL